MKRIIAGILCRGYSMTKVPLDKIISYLYPLRYILTARDGGIFNNHNPFWAAENNRRRLELMWDIRDMCGKSMSKGTRFTILNRFENGDAYGIEKDGYDQQFKTLAIPKKMLDKINEYLAGSCEHLDEDTPIIFTAQFPNGYQMDIKCCGTQDPDDPAWTEAVLFDKQGYELACSEVYEEFEGLWELKYKGVTYAVNVVSEDK